MALLHNPIVLLLVIVILGEMLGRVRLWSLTLGPAAIVFVALAFGHFGLTLPQGMQTAGLALFIYAVGLQAGPGFLSSFRSHGLPMAIGVFAMVVAGTAVAYLCCRLFGFDPGTGAGLLSGAMTSTPALAAAVESVGHHQAPAAFGLTYGFGMLGVALFIKLLPQILRVDVRVEEERIAKELTAVNPPITFHHIEVSNPNLFGKRVADLFLNEIAPVTLTRLLREGGAEPELVGADTVLMKGDRVRVVGRLADLEKVELYIGKPVTGEIAFDRVLAKKSIVVSKRRFAGTTLGYFNFREAFNVQIARITRNGIDLPADANTRLHLGDLVHAVGDERSLQNVTRILGNDLKATYEISLLPLLIGLLLGFLLGKVVLPLPFIGPLPLGTAGGTLVAGLVLGARYQTGPLIWDLPTTGNHLIREVGLALFLATAGTSAGVSLVATIKTHGLPLLFSGMAVTLVPVAVGTLLGLWWLRVRFLRLLGMLVGGMTNASGLAATGTVSPTSFAPAAYATVYPIALISKILAVKLLLLIL
jgi:putative transport protein